MSTFELIVGELYLDMEFRYDIGGEESRIHRSFGGIALHETLSSAHKRTQLNDEYGTVTVYEHTQSGIRSVSTRYVGESRTLTQVFDSRGMLLDEKEYDT